MNDLSYRQRLAQFKRELGRSVDAVTPYIRSTSTLGSILYSIYETFQIGIAMLPIVMSYVSLSALFPAFFAPYSTPLIYGIIGLISIFAGYQTYSSYHFRAKQDRQIIDNQQATLAHERTIAELRERVQALEARNVPAQRRHPDPERSPPRRARSAPLLFSDRVLTPSEPTQAQPHAFSSPRV